MNTQKSSHVATVAIAMVALYVLGTSDSGLFNVPTSIDAAPKAPVKLTPTLVAWISSQSENIIEEMEAIVKQQVETNQFSVVYYLRYLNLFDSLKVVGEKSQVDKFHWIAKKVKAFSRVYKSITDIVEVYLRDLDARMYQIEMAEKKGKQVGVTAEWVNLYETINYIKTHAPRNSGLAKEAAADLVKSPTSSADKRRSTRYLLHRNAFN